MWGTVIGILGGMGQDVINYIINKKYYKLFRRLGIKGFDYESRSRKTSYSPSVSHGHNTYKPVQQNLPSSWHNKVLEGYARSNISKLDKIAYVFILTARPMISYLFILFAFVIYLTNLKLQPEWMGHFVEVILYELEAVVSFWFYRRSSDKANLFLTKIPDRR